MNALILVDIQNDFLPGGALAVPRGDEVVPVANRLMERFPLVVATQDWHPENHGSFASNQGKPVGTLAELGGLPQVLWPNHCVQNTGGAAFASGLNTAKIARIFPKGTDPEIDSYSGFFDNGRRRETDLHKYLQGRGVNEVHVMGLATDYCVRATALDAAKHGYRTVLLTEGIRGVEAQPGDCQRAIQEMQAAGVIIQ